MTLGLVSSSYQPGCGCYSTSLHSSGFIFHLGAPTHTTVHSVDTKDDTTGHLFLVSSHTFLSLGATRLAEGLTERLLPIATGIAVAGR